MNEIKLKRGFQMQRTFLFFAFFCVSAATVFAQDIITLKNGDDIQALVQEIGTDEVKYKKFDNPNGPNYTLKKSEIFMIRYENGSKDVFTKQETPQNDPETVVKQQNTTQNQSIVQQNPQSDIEQMKNEFYRIKRTDREAMSSFFGKYDDVFYERYASASKQRNAGGVLFGIGAGLFVGGIVYMIMPVTGEENGTAIGCVIMGVGTVFCLVGLPINLTGASKQKSIINDFEYKYFSGNRYSYQPTLNFGLTANGVGLALKF